MKRRGGRLAAVPDPAGWTRRFGGAACAALAAALLVREGASATQAVVLPTAWLAGLGLGGRWFLWRSVAATWPDVRLDRRQTWTGALIGGATGLVLGWAATGAAASGLSATTALAVFGPPWLLAYAAGKIGCHRLGCCRARRPSRRSLPLAEAAISAVLGAGLLALGLAESAPPAALAAGFALCHLVQRRISWDLRGGADPIWRPDRQGGRLFIRS